MRFSQIILIAHLSLYCFILPASASDEEKAAAFEAGKPEVLERLMQHSTTVPAETRSIVREVLDYNWGRSDDLILAKQTMLPGSDSPNKAYVIEKLRFDAVTIPIFEALLKGSSNDSVKARIVWRIRHEALSADYSLSDEMHSLLESFLADEYSGTDVRRASELTLRQVREMEANGELVTQSPGANVEPVAEIPATWPEEAEAVNEVEAVSASEPVIEEPAAILESEESPSTKALEVVEKSTDDKSPFAWLWIVGVLILLTSLGLALTRKKS